MEKEKLASFEEKIYRSQIVLLAYLEREAAAFYRQHGQLKSYLDQFERNSKHDPDMDDCESIEYQILDILKKNDDYDILREAVMGILVTSATSTVSYNEPAAAKKVGLLLGLEVQAESTTYLDSTSPAESDDDDVVTSGMHRLEI